VASLPQEWLVRDGEPLTAEDRRSGYLEFFQHRLKTANEFVEEAIEAHAQLF
jgi:hypothetical protein